MTIAIPNIFKESFTAFRRAAGSYVAGRWVEGAESSFDVVGSSQPLIGGELSAQLLLMPEGQRKREMRKFYTDQVLRTIDQPNKLAADQLLIAGIRFEVMNVLNHSTNNNSHMKVILAKVNL